jgi:hypothetical protein
MCISVRKAFMPNARRSPDIKRTRLQRPLENADATIEQLRSMLPACPAPEDLAMDVTAMIPPKSALEGTQGIH